MNIRRGFQRVYGLLTVAWIALVIFMVLSNRWICEPWWRVLPISYDTFYNNLTEQAGLPPNAKVEEMPSVFINRYFQIMGDINDHLRAKKAIWIAALSLPLPIFGYLLLFGALPWIYRGFKPSPRTHRPALI